MTFQIAGLSGSLSTPSRTQALVATALQRALTRFNAQTSCHGLAELQPSLGAAGRLDELAPGPAAIVARLLAADALVLGVPVYKGSYPGLFKHLFDLINPEALRGKPVLLVATGGGERHALVIEHQLRPLMGFFEAATLPTGVYASGADFTAGQPAAPALLDRLDRALDALAPLVAARTGLTRAA